MLTILQWYKTSYDSQEVLDYDGLEKVLYNHYSQDPVKNKILCHSFDGSILLLNNMAINSTVALLTFLSLGKNHSTSMASNIMQTAIIQGERWIDSNIMNNIFLLAIAQYDLLPFRGKTSLFMEKMQVGNANLLRELHLLELQFSHQPWFLGENFSICDISLFFFLRAILQKNPSILASYGQLEKWFQRMNSKSNFLSFL
jgi:hypothetical protein